MLGISLLSAIHSRVAPPLGADPESRTGEPCRRGKKTGSVALTCARCSSAIEVGVGLHERVDAGADVLAHELVPARERAHEAPQQRPAGAHVGCSRATMIELVVGRHADLVHAQDHGLPVLALELDALDVPEHAEDGVDALGQQRRDEVEADVDRLDAVGVGAGLLEDRLQVGVLVGDAGGADLLALELRRAADRPAAERDDRRQRLLDERADRDELGALRAREQQLGLVGDREVGLARGEQLQRRRRVRRRARLDVELAVLNSPSSIAA